MDCVVAQRLVAPAVPECKKPHDAQRRRRCAGNGFNVGLDLEAYEPVGCARCGGSGYKGRIGLYEVMCGDRRRSATLDRRAQPRRRRSRRRRSAQGMRPLREDGLEKVSSGITSIAEVARVTVRA